MSTGPVQHEITRKIWGDGDTVLLIFAGAAAEFALNRAVEWLFFTGALPRDPLGRLFRTVGYAQNIAFAPPPQAYQTLERIRRVHISVEQRRGQVIPAWAHRAVLYMLIDYSERAAHLLHRPLDPVQHEALYSDFRRIGQGLGIDELPLTYAGWKIDRARRMSEDLGWSPLTATLYTAYRRHLGPVRYELLRQLQGVLVPASVRMMLHLPVPAVGSHLMVAWRAIRALRLGPAARRLVVPLEHWSHLTELESRSAPQATGSSSGDR